MNYVSFIVKILEEPQQQFLGYEDYLTVTEFNGQYVTIQNQDHSNTIKIKIWGNLAYQIKEYYHINDYILVEGIITIKNNQHWYTPNFYPEITAKRIYPFLLNSNKNS